MIAISFLKKATKHVFLPSLLYFFYVFSFPFVFMAKRQDRFQTHSTVAVNILRKK